MFFVAVVLLSATAATATEFQPDGVLYGTIVAAQAGPGEPGTWRYEMRVTWVNNSSYALSHFNLNLDDGANCSYQDIVSYLIWESPAGQAQCFGINSTVYFDAVLMMDGDPSLGIYVPIIKYEPNGMSETRTGTRGVGVFTFWSNLSPWPIDEPNDLLSEKFGLLHSFGGLDGVFPALPCNPIAARQQSWGMVKAGYGR
jgi:hypothetical protein